MKVFSAEEFADSLPREMLDLLEELNEEGIGCTFVGGCVRDYLLEGNLPSDVDIEIRWKKGNPEKIGEMLKKKHGRKVEFFPFGVLKIEQDGGNIELASPRQERFGDSDWYGHSDFKGFIKGDLPFGQAVLRRDFSINAIGIEAKKEEKTWRFCLNDPLGGIGDLEKRLLRPCGEDFFKDPVRFLRMVRFQIKLGFELDDELVIRINEFNLKGLTDHYFFSEACKSFFPLFVAKIFDYADKKLVDLPGTLDWLLPLRGFCRLEGKPVKLDNPEECLFFLIFSKVPPGSEYLKKFCLKACLKKNMIDKQERSRELLEKAQGLSQKALGKKLAELPLEKALNLEELAWLADFHRTRGKLAKNCGAMLEKINPTFYKYYLAFDALVPETLSGEAMFQKKIEEDTIPKESRGLLRVYCHLISSGMSRF